MKFSTPIIAALAAMPVQGYSLWGPTLFETPSLSFAPMIRRQQEMARNFDDTFAQLSPRFDETFKQLSPRYEIVNNSEQFQIAMDVPGVKMEDVHVSLEEGGKMLNIRGSRRAISDESSFTSQFSQSFSLDPVIDVENIQANLMDGVLTITAPKDMKRLEANVRSIPVLASAPPVMEAPKLSAANEEKVEEVAKEEKMEETVEVTTTGEEDGEVQDLDKEEKPKVEL